MKATTRQRRRPFTRRGFLGGGLAAGAALSQACSIVPRSVLGGRGHVPPSEKLNIGIIGCGGKGLSDMREVSSENILALCDVDDARAAEAYRDQPRAHRYHDYREMFDKEPTLDAVIVATPDHHHAPASMLAIERRIHVYCQKPLTHSIYEASRLKEAARRYRVVTQMGNQGTANDGLRRAVEIVQAGGIGPVREVHVWTNRPVWPQGIERPAPEPVPSTMQWDLWLGPAPERPYSSAYAPFAWRGWCDFGTGALGDMACHTANMPYMALKLTQPTRVEARTSEFNRDSYPSWSLIRYEFPARAGMPACTFWWYDGGKLPPADLAPELSYQNSGCLLVGDKGLLYSPNDYGAAFKLLPEKDFEGYEGPPQTLPRSPGHYKEWINACKGSGPDPMSNFDYSAELTMAILMGNLAIRVGHEIDWNARRLVATNCDQAAPYVRRDYRPGYHV